MITAGNMTAMSKESHQEAPGNVLMPEPGESFSDEDKDEGEQFLEALYDEVDFDYTD